MTSDENRPATKEDVRLLMEQIGRLYDATEGWKDEMRDTTERWKDEVKGHFDLAVETIRHDLLGANRDDIASMKDRLTRLERQTGLAAR